MANRRNANRWLHAALAATVVMLATSGLSLAGTIKPFPGAGDPELDEDAPKQPMPKERKRGTVDPCKSECSMQLSTCAMGCGGAQELKDDDEEQMKKDKKDKKLAKRQMSAQDKCVQKCADTQQKCLSSCK